MSSKQSIFTFKHSAVTSDYFEERTSKYAVTSKLYSSNIKNDFLLFLSLNSDIKIMDVRNGEYIGDIDGAHFKGTTNYTLMINSGPRSSLKETLYSIEKYIQNSSEKKVKEDNSEENSNSEDGEKNEELIRLFSLQLNDYMLISNSSKDKIRVWGFENGASSLIAQDNSLGGMLDSQMVILEETTGNLVVASCGNCSNKIELFSLTPAKIKRKVKR